MNNIVKIQERMSEFQYNLCFIHVVYFTNVGSQGYVVCDDNSIKNSYQRSEGESQNTRIKNEHATSTLNDLYIYT